MGVDVVVGSDVGVGEIPVDVAVGWVIVSFGPQAFRIIVNRTSVGRVVKLFVKMRIFFLLNSWL
jgi:hypothetical protein